MTKYIFIAVLVLLAVTSGMAQVKQATPTAPRIVQVQLNDSVAVSATYANSQNDTTVSYQLSGYKRGALLIQTSDSARVSVKYMPSFDGSTFKMAPIFIDSLTTANMNTANSGGSLVAVLPEGAMSAVAVKFVITFASANNGVTSPTYSAKLLLKD